jgi:hypothetical protein
LAEQLKLFHGTSNSSFLDSIMTDGLKPRNDRLGNWFSPGKIASHKDFVYLTSALKTAHFYGLRSAIVNNCSQYTILQTPDLDEDKLYPDENLFVKPALFNIEDVVRAQNQIFDNQKSWQKCLDKTTLATYHGVVENVVEYETKPIRENLYYWMVDQTETIKEMDLKHRTREWLIGNGYLNEHNDGEKYRCKINFEVMNYEFWVDDRILFVGPYGP